jgi:UDP-3-O-[3-hydroxymyristoyl] glucosamine N-acyltransferase
LIKLILAIDLRKLGENKSMTTRNIKISEISEILSSDYIGNDVNIDSLNLINRESEYKNIMTYITDESFIQYIDNDRIRGLFIDKNLLNLLDKKLFSNKTFFITEAPEKDFYILHNYLSENTNFYKTNILNHRGKNVTIHPASFIEDKVYIGNNVTIGANAVIHKNTILGDNVNILSGAIIGGEGFQVLFDKNIPYLVNHAGGVKIGNNVRIGNNTCIANSIFEGFTEVGDNTKIDNLVHIAHNCKIGKNCIVVPGVVLLGSSILEDNVWVSPNSVILNKVIIRKNGNVGSMSLVARNVKENTKVFGIPAKKMLF